jgi:hypothetical protein
MPNSLRFATSFRLDDAHVETCVMDAPADRQFARAWRDGLGAIPRDQRLGALAGVTGHIAESVVELLLDEWGYAMLWHFANVGRHGIDLLALDPASDLVVAFEVKGTLRSGVWPRLSRRALLQMSAAWIDKADNPGMANWDLQTEDVYGGMVAVNFADMAYRVALTNDFELLQPIRTLDQLSDLSWLKVPCGSAPPP